MSTILITGSNRGIGYELTTQYLEDGWSVYACCRHPMQAKQLQNLQSSYPTTLHIIQLDVSDPKQIQELGLTLNTAPIDILLNNAGVWEPDQHLLGQIEQKEFIDVLKTNTIGPLLLIQALLPSIKQGTLKIIANMSSGLGSINNNTQGANYVYRASKSGLNAISKSLAVDLKNEGICVVALNPGWVQTDMGGPNAPTTVQESARGLRNVLSKVTLATSGHFLRFDDTESEW